MAGRSPSARPGPLSRFRIKQSLKREAASGPSQAPIYNKYGNDFLASLIVMVHKLNSGETEVYIAPLTKIEKLLRSRPIAHAAKPKRGRNPGPIAFSQGIAERAARSLA